MILRFLPLFCRSYWETPDSRLYDILRVEIKNKYHLRKSWFSIGSLFEPLERKLHNALRCLSHASLLFASIFSLFFPHLLLSLPTSLPSLGGSSIVLIANVLVGHPAIPNSFSIHGEDGPRLMEMETNGGVFRYWQTGRKWLKDREKRERQLFILKTNWKPENMIYCIISGFAPVCPVLNNNCYTL